MAISKIRPMHHLKGTTLEQCLKDRIQYSDDPDKTDGGTYVSAYRCNPSIAWAEFAMTKFKYAQITGRTQKNDVIAYQVVQSFKPGEIEPSVANRIGYEFAERFLKGKHAFMVCTHVDKDHIHNHIVWNSTAIDGTRKFRNSFYSAYAVRKLSDLICMEYGLSIIENPQRFQSKDRRQFEPTHRDYIRTAINSVLENQSPESWELFLKLMEEEGFEVKRGKSVRVKSKGQKNFIRLNTLGDGYREDDLKRVIYENQTFRPRPSNAKFNSNMPRKIRDINWCVANIHGKGPAYLNAIVQKNALLNIKSLVETVYFMDENNLRTASLKEKTQEVTEAFHQSERDVAQATNDRDMWKTEREKWREIRGAVQDYHRTRSTFSKYREVQKYKSKKAKSNFYEQHKNDIDAYRNARQVIYQKYGFEKMPSYSDCQSKIKECTDNADACEAARVKAIVDRKASKKMMKAYQVYLYNAESFNRVVYDDADPERQSQQKNAATQSQHEKKIHREHSVNR